MRFISTLSFFYILICIPSVFGQVFKTIGYLPYYRFELIDQIDINKLTHLNIAFANPDLNGDLSTGGQDISIIVQKARAVNVEVFISLAGAVLSSDQESAWSLLLQPAQRAAFIHKIIQYVRSNDLQGIDVDLEWSHVDDNYSDFVLALRDSIDQYGLSLSAALPGHYRYPQISDQALSAFDWINMMVYDLTGPWAPQNPGPHSTFEHATEAIQNWSDQGVDKNRLTLGVPFYGYDFSNPSMVIARSYREMVQLDSENANVDAVGPIYYNGLATIEAKTRLALNELSGIMIWELGQDDFGQYSLLNRIWQTVETTVSSDDIILSDIVHVYPNPFYDHFMVEGVDAPDCSVQLYNQTGKLVYQTPRTDNIIQVNLPAGVFFMRLSCQDRIAWKKLIKSN